ncbi:MAG: hypothetical protein AAGB01_12005 [Cyanobacteria bacterium P01_F01_bin.42]
MWVVWKRVGIFDHYLSQTGEFQASLTHAQRYISKEIAQTMATRHQAAVKELPSAPASPKG